MELVSACRQVLATVELQGVLAPQGHTGKAVEQAGMGVVTRGCICKGVKHIPALEGQQLPAGGTARVGMWSAARVEPFRLLQSLFLQRGCLFRESHMSLECWTEGRRMLMSWQACSWAGGRLSKVGRWLCPAAQIHHCRSSLRLKRCVPVSPPSHPALCNLVFFSLPPAGPGTGRVDNGSMSLAVPLWLLAASLLCLLSKC